MRSPILYQKSGCFLTGGSLHKMQSDSTRKKKQSYDMDIHIGQTDFVFYSQDKHAPRAVYMYTTSILKNLQEEEHVLTHLYCLIYKKTIQTLMTIHLYHLHLVCIA